MHFKRNIKKISRRMYRYPSFRGLRWYPTNRKLNKMRRQSRSNEKVPGHVSLFGWDLEYADAYNAAEMFQLQVLDGYNDFACTNQQPYILDCGANIGLSVLRYKYLYPFAEIVAFEPDPVLCRMLRRNIIKNDVNNVEVIQAAVWCEQTMLEFAQEATDGGSLMLDKRVRDWAETNKLPMITVPAVRLADYLNRQVDLLKIDIEGAELPVLEDCASKLSCVENLIVEVHFRTDEADYLAAILSILHQAGFKVSINTLEIFVVGQRSNENAQKRFGQIPLIRAWR